MWGVPFPPKAPYQGKTLHYKLYDCFKSFISSGESEREDGLVVSIERIPELAEKAERTLRKLGYDNVIVIVGDGTLGYEPLAPYDRIYTTAAGPKIPEPLIKQLKDGGKLLMPVGRYLQKLVLAEKRGDEIIVKDYGSVAFVPLVGKEGFYG
jgi:protein-L-isoaspartate(D-aspartate) O-methyltransferase